MHESCLSNHVQHFRLVFSFRILKAVFSKRVYQQHFVSTYCYFLVSTKCYTDFQTQALQFSFKIHRKVKFAGRKSTRKFKFSLEISKKKFELLPHLANAIFIQVQQHHVIYPSLKFGTHTKTGISFLEAAENTKN